MGRGAWIGRSFESWHLHNERRFGKLNSITNRYRLNGEKKQKSTPPQISRNESKIELEDLGLLLRRVKLEPAIDGMTEIFLFGIGNHQSDVRHVPRRNR